MPKQSKKTTNQFKVGSFVTWQWLGRPINGVIKEVHPGRVEKNIKGKKIVRNGSKDKPAYLVESKAGNLALKLETELSLQEHKKRKKTPTMFGDED